MAYQIQGPSKIDRACNVIGFIISVGLFGGLGYFIYSAEPVRPRAPSEPVHAAKYVPEDLQRYRQELARIEQGPNRQREMAALMRKAAAECEAWRRAYAVHENSNLPASCMLLIAEAARGH